MFQQLSFKEKQLQFSRVKAAYQAKEITVKNYFNHKNLNYQGFQLFLRAFKKERKLEVWVKPLSEMEYRLLVEYDFCAGSGVLGPKRREGDRQIPEGVYFITHFNPQSNFHLSLGINYPNRSDKLLGGPHPGSAIYIHGDCVTIGCIPITDDKIKELYILATDAREQGQQHIPVHIFPTRMDQSRLDTLVNATGTSAEVIAFWKNLSTIYQHFEAYRALKEVKINTQGRYHF